MSCELQKMSLFGLTTKQLKDYENHGFISPVDIWSLEEATKIKVEIELMSKKDVALRTKANKELSKIFYSGAKEGGNINQWIHIYYLSQSIS